MGLRWLLLYVICQTVITESLGGITLSLPDIVGKVTPIKPKPLSPSAVSSSPLICENKDILPKLFSPAPGSREFTSLLALTSSSQAFPVPKIDSSSIADVKMPERLKEKILLPKLCNAPVSNAKLDTGTPDVSLPYKYPFISSSTKPQKALPTYSSWDMYSSSLNNIPSLTNVKSFPTVPVKSSKSSNTDVLCSASKLNDVLTQQSITSFSGSRSLESPLTSEVKRPLFSEQFNSKTFSPLTHSSSSYPLYYKSRFLPGVRTPSESLIFKPTSYKADKNIDFPSQSTSRNFLSLKNLTSNSCPYSLPVNNDPYLSSYMNPIKTAEILKSNTIQLPKPPSSVSIKPVFLAQNAADKNLWQTLEANSDSASVAFECRYKQPEILSSPVLKDCTDQKMQQIPDFKLEHSTPLKMKPSVFGSPSNFLNSPVTSLVPISPSPPITDVLSKRLSNFDYSKNINSLEMLPIVGSCVANIEKFNTYDISCNCQTCVDSKHVASLERINLSSPLAPELASYQHPLFTEECVTNPRIFSPPIIPLEPIPTISSQYSACYPITYFPSQTPSSISYINQSPASSIAQLTANMVSCIHNLVSNIAQNILSSYKSYIDSTTQNVPQIPTYTFPSNPNDNLEILPILPLSQGNLVISEPVLPVCINPPASSDAPCKSSAFEVSSSQPLLISATQPTDTMTPPISLFALTSPQLCPSYLPSPSLPSYPTISSPLYMEPPVFKVISSKDSDVEKLTELLLLAEILNNEKNFDWNDLDTLLAFLSVS